MYVTMSMSHNEVHVYAVYVTMRYKLYVTMRFMHYMYNEYNLFNIKVYAFYVQWGTSSVCYNKVYAVRYGEYKLHFNYELYQLK